LPIAHLAGLAEPLTLHPHLSSTNQAVQSNSHQQLLQPPIFSNVNGVTEKNENGVTARSGNGETVIMNTENGGNARSESAVTETSGSVGMQSNSEPVIWSFVGQPQLADTVVGDWRRPAYTSLTKVIRRETMG
jgi:hypothetical protein